MKMKQIILALTLLCNIRSMAQVRIPDAVEKIRRAMEAMPMFSYDYTVKQTYQDGSSSMVKGKVTSTKDYYYESNSGEMIFQTWSWYYKADYESKTIYIINLDNLRKRSKAKVSLQRMNILPDSLLNKYGNLKTTTEGPMLKLEITFNKDVLLKKMLLEYDTQRKLPKTYKVESDVLYDIDKQSFEELYAKQEMVASNFQAISKQGPIRTDDYFEYKNGKIILKKYSNYKLIQRI